MLVRLLPPSFLSRPTATALGLLLVTLLVLPACDSDDDDPIDEVGGTYELTDLRFRGSGLPTVDLFADSLDNSVQLRDNVTLFIASRSGEFDIRYEFVGGGSDRLEGTVSRSGDRVRFDIQSGNPSDLLLPSQEEGTDFTLQIDRTDGGPIRLVSRGTALRRGDVNLRPYNIDQPSVTGNIISTFVKQ